MSVPAARILTVADAFLAELNAQLVTWNVVTPQTAPDPDLPVVAERKYSTQYSISELDVLHVDVQTATLEEEIIDRATVVKHYGINVTIQKTVDPKDVAAIDTLVNLAVAIFEHWPLEAYVGTLETVSMIASAGRTHSAVLLYSPVLLDGQTKFFGMASFVFAETTARGN